MISEKFKRSITAVLKKNKYQCSISIQNIDSHVIAFANLRGAKVSWGRLEMTVFVPGEITFQIPYREIESSRQYDDRQIEIVLEGRNLVSIREANKTRRRA